MRGWPLLDCAGVAASLLRQVWNAHASSIGQMNDKIVVAKKFPGQIDMRSLK
jgi:hypothetical protein